MPILVLPLTATLAAILPHGARASLHGADSRDAGAVERVIDALPKPPAIEGLSGLERSWAPGRSRYLRLVTHEAERHGLPAAVADSVVAVESGYNPMVIGKVGEIGLMQVLPATAAMLGFKGSTEALSQPETNIRYGVEYLAEAWRLAGGDLCRALMKYRAGHGTELMTPLSVEYCRRARAHLASVGSPLATQPDGSGPTALPVQVASTEPTIPVSSRRESVEEQRRAALQNQLAQRFVAALASVGGRAVPAGAPGQGGSSGRPKAGPDRR